MFTLHTLVFLKKNVKSEYFEVFYFMSLFFSAFIQSVEVLEVKILDSYTITKEFPGKLLPTEQSKLAFEISGKIKNIYVDVGDSVEKGDILAKLDDREALARLNQAKASFDLSKQILERFQDLKVKDTYQFKNLIKLNQTSLSLNLNLNILKLSSNKQISYRLLKA